MANKKNDFYWNNYVSAADVACRAAHFLLECLKDYNIDSIKEMLTKMHEFEHEGDSLRHEMSTALAKSFVTPIDREDMAEMSYKLDHVTDSIEEVLQSLYINNIEKIYEEAITFAEKICVCTTRVKEMFTELPNFKKSAQMHQFVVDVNAAEEECDTLYLQANYDIRKNWNGENPLDVISWKEIYSKLEECADACEHVADTVEAVVMKNT
ncbi:MAG: DUF47 family protein [Eubacterium sp.]|nr:DUF47 family protein [Eubacterium sp.]